MGWERFGYMLFIKSDNRMKAVCVKYLIIMIGHCPLAFKQCKIKNKKSKQKHFFFSDMTWHHSMLSIQLIVNQIIQTLTIVKPPSIIQKIQDIKSKLWQWLFVQDSHQHICCTCNWGPKGKYGWQRLTTLSQGPGTTLTPRWVKLHEGQCKHIW